MYSPKHKSSRTMMDYAKTGFEAIRNFFWMCPNSKEEACTDDF